MIHLVVWLAAVVHALWFVAFVGVLVRGCGGPVLPHAPTVLSVTGLACLNFWAGWYAGRTALDNDKETR